MVKLYSYDKIGLTNNLNPFMHEVESGQTDCKNFAVFIPQNF